MSAVTHIIQKYEFEC